MSEEIFAPVYFFGGGLVMVVALSVTMSALRALERVCARVITPKTKSAVGGGASTEPDEGPGGGGANGSQLD